MENLILFLFFFAFLLIGLFICFFINVPLPKSFFLKSRIHLFRLIGIGLEFKEQDGKDAITDLVSLFLAALTQTGALIALNRDRGVDRTAVLFYFLAMCVTTFLMFLVIRVESSSGIRAVNRATFQLGKWTMMTTVVVMVFASTMALFDKLPFQNHENYRGAVKYTFKNSPGEGAELLFTLNQSKFPEYDGERGVVPGVISLQFSNALTTNWEISKDIVVSRSEQFDERIDAIRRLSVGNQFVWNVNLDNIEGPLFVKVRLKHRGLIDHLEDDRKQLDKQITVEDAINVTFTYLITDEQLRKNVKSSEPRLP